jgi:hypothetical protein
MIMEKVVKKIGLKDQQSDFAFWQSKSPEERLAAVELLRDQYIKFIQKDVKPGLQRVCRVIKQTQC